MKLIKVLLLSGLFLSFINSSASALCTVTGVSGSGFLFAGQCAPVTTGIYYDFTFDVKPTPTTFRVIYFWGDGLSESTYPTVQSKVVYTPAPVTVYFVHAELWHTYPAAGNCEYYPYMILVDNGSQCSDSRQTQIVANWQQDDIAAASGVIALNPTPRKDVCVGLPLVDFQFTDASRFSCNLQQYPSAQKPNHTARYEQFVYGTGPVAGRGIPNLSIKVGTAQTIVQLTDVNGNPIPGPWNVNPTTGGLVAPYNTQSGFFEGPIVQIPLNAVTGTYSLNNSYPISFNGVGDAFQDQFQVTIRNWNVCNPWNGSITNPNVSGPEPIANSATALIYIINGPLANAGADDAICAGSSYNMNGSVTNATSSSWTRTDGTFTGFTNRTSPNGAVFTPTAADRTAGSVNLILHAYALGGCTEHTDIMKLTIDPIPTAPTISLTGGPNGFCDNNSTSLTLTSTVSPNSTYLWTPTSNNNQSITLNDYTQSGNYTVTVYGTTANACPRTSASFAVTIGQPAIVDAGPATATICSTPAYNTAGSYGGSATTVTWSTNGNGVFGDVNDPTTTYTPGSTEIASGAVVLTLLTNDPAGLCPAVSDFITLTVITSPQINAGADAAICQGSTYKVTDAAATNYNTIAWTENGAGSLSGAGTLTPTYTPAAGDYGNSVTLTLTATGNGPCATVIDTKVLYIDRTPGATVGAAQNICGTLAALGTLSGNNGGSDLSNGATGIWRFTDTWMENFTGLNGQGIDVGPTSWSRAVNFTGAGWQSQVVASERYRVTNNQTVWTTGTINISGQANIGIFIDFSSYATGNGFEATDLIQARYILDGVPTLFYSTTGAVDVTTGAASVPLKSFQATASSINGTNLVIQITLRTNQNDEIYEFDNITVRKDGSTVINNPTSANTTVTNLAQGANSFTWTVSSAHGGCSPASANLTINRDNPPAAANAGADQSLCEINNTTLAGNVVTNGGTGLWTHTSGPAGYTITTPSAYNSTVTNLAFGTHVFRWTITGALGTCTSSDNVTIARYPDPLDRSGNVTILKTPVCYNTPGQLRITNTEADVRYYLRTGGADGSYVQGNGGTITLTTPNLTAATNYQIHAIKDVTGCNIIFGSYTINVNPQFTLAQLVDDQNICSGDPATISVTLTGGTGPYTVTINNGIGVLNNYVSGTPVTTPNLVATTIYTITSVTDANTCTPASLGTPITVTVGSTPSNATFTGNGPLCYNTAGTLTSVITGGSPPYVLTITGYSGTTFTSPTVNASIPLGVQAPGTYNYSLTSVVDACGNPLLSGLPKNYSLTVYNNLTAGSVGTAQTICYNTTPSGLTELTAPAGGTLTYTYQWQSSPDNSTWTDIATGGTAATYNPGTLTSNTYYRRNVTSGTCGTVSSASVLITVMPNLTPGSVGAAQTICYNATAALLTELTAPAGATGTYAFQWQSSPDNLTWTDVASGGTSSTYSPGALTASIYFRRNVTSGTCTTVSSAPVLITVYGNLTPGSVGTAQTICYSTTPSGLTVVSAPAGGTGTYAYQWQSSPDNSTWTNVASGGTAATYSPGTLTSTTYYRRNVTSGTCGTVSTTPVLITVNAILTAGSIATDQTICYNTTPAGLTETTVATGGPGAYTYQWESSPNNSTWTNVAAGGTSAAYAPGALTATTYFRRNVTSGSCGTLSSNSVLITVNPVFTAGSVGTAQTICYNTTPAGITELTAPAGGTGTYSFQWQSSPNNSTWTDIPTGGTLATYSPGALTATTYFRRNVTSGTCGTLSSASVLITVYADLTAGTVGNSQTICYNATAAGLIQLTAATGGTGTYTYQWQSSPDNSIWTNVASGGTAGIYSPGALTTTTYFRRNVISGTCGTVSSSPVLITVHPVLSGGTIGSDETICFGGDVTAFTNIAAASGGAGAFTYTWQYTTNMAAVLGDANWTNIPLSNSTTWDYGTLTATTRFVRRAIEGTCSATQYSNIVTVTVRPALSGGTIGNNQTICYGTDVAAFINTAAASGGAGTFTYTWQYTTNMAAIAGDANWTDIPLSNSLTIDYGTLTTPTRFVRRAVDLSCPAPVYSNPITININPLPSTSDISGPIIVCEGAVNQVYSVVNTPGSTYHWTLPASLTRITPDGLYYIIVDAGPGVPLPTDEITVTETFPTPTFCVGPTKHLPVVVQPTIPGVNITGPGQVCIGAANVIYSVPSHAGSIYSWVVPAGASIMTNPALNQIEVTFNMALTGTISVMETTGAMCTTIHNPKTVVINPLPTIYNLTSPVAYCATDLGVTLNLSGSQASVPLVVDYEYQLYKNGVADGASVSGTGSAVTWTNKTVGSYYVVATNVTTGCVQQMSGTPSPVINLITAGSIGTSNTICEGTSPAPFTSVAAATGAGSITYQWQVSTDNGATYANIPGATSAVYTAGILNQDTYYIRIGYSTLGTSVCAAQTAPVIVTVNNFDPGIISAAQTICEGLAPAMLTGTAPSGDPGAITYQWRSSTDGITYNNILGANSDSYTSPSLTQDTWLIRSVTSTLNGRACTKETNAVKVMVVNFAPGSIGLDQTICEGTTPAPFSGVAASGDGSFLYQWQSSPDNSSWTDIGTATGINYTVTVPLIADTYYRRRVTPTLNALCIQYTNTILVTVNNFDPGTISAPQTICEGTAPAPFTDVAASGDNSVYSYLWQNSTNGSTWVNIPGATNQLYTSSALAQDTWFRRQATSLLNGDACTKYTPVILVTVNNITAGAISGAETLCEGMNATGLTSAGTFTDGTPALQWQSSPDNATWTSIPGANLATYSPLALAADTWYKLVVTSTIGANICTDETNVIKITVNNLDPGALGTDQTICENTSPAPLTSMSPLGDGVITYKWYSSVDGTNFNLIATAISETYSPGLLLADTWYRRDVTSTLNGRVCTKLTNVIRITVNNFTPGTIAGDQTICDGQTPAAFTATVPPTFDAGAIISYQWKESTDGVSFTDINLANGPTYAPGILTQDMWYRRAVTSDLNGKICTEETNTLKVTVINFSEGSIGGDQTICEGTTPTTFTSIPSSGDGVRTYLWQSSPDNTTWSDIGTATGATYTVTVPLIADTYYRRRVTATIGSTSCIQYTNSVLVTVNNFIPGSIAADQTICEGSTPAAFTSVPPTGDGTFTYQWQSSIDGVSFSNITGATADNYTAGALLQDTWYRLSVTSTLNGNSCTKMTNIVKVTVVNFNAGTISAAQTICDGTTPVAFTSVLPTGDGVFTYQWQDSPDGITFTTIGGATAATYAPGVLASDTWYIRVVTSTLNAVPCVKETNVIRITVNNFIPGSISANETICDGSFPVGFTSVTPTGDGVFTYQWQSSINGTVFSDIAGTIFETYNSITLTQDTWFKRKVTSTIGLNSCIKETNIILVTVNNFVPGSISAAQTICEGGMPAAFASVTPTGDGIFGYQWRSSLDGLNFTDIAGATLETYTAGALLQDTWYKRVVTSTLNGVTCTKETNSVRITVNNVQGGTIISDQTICSGSDPVSFMSIVNGSGDGVLAFQWQVSTDGATFTDIAGANAPNYDAAALTSDRWYKRITKSVLNTVECTKETNVVKVTINAVTGGTITSAQTICYGNVPLAITSTDDGTGSGVVTYQWQQSDNNVTWINIPGATTFGYAPGALLSDKYYKRVIISILNGIVCTSESNAIKMTINPLPVALLSGGETICPAQTSNLVVTMPVGLGSFEVEIDDGSLGFTVVGYISGANIPVTPAVTTTYNLKRVKDSNGCEVLFPSANLNGTATVVVSIAPSIASFTPSPAVCEFTLATYKVTANGTNLAYQWQVNTGSGFTDVADGGTYFGATTPALQIFNSVRTMNGYIYHVKVSGCGTDVFSADATFTVNTAPEFTKHPSDSTVCFGNNATMEADATGTSVTWQWYVNKGAGFVVVQPDANFSGETTKTLTITNAPGTFNNWIFRAKATGTCGVPAFTNFARLSVTNPPVPGLPSAPKVICENGSTSFLGNGSGYIGLKWQVSTDGGGSWSDISNIDPLYLGASTNQLSIVNAPVTLNGNQYHLSLIGSCKTVNTNDVLLTVNPNPVVSFAADINACGGVPVVLNGNPTGGSGVYTQHRWTGDVGPLNNYTIQSPTFNSLISGTYNLNYRVTDSKGCTANSDLAVIVDSPSAEFTQSIDNGCTPLNVTFTKDMTGISKFWWDFNDSSPIDSVNANPVHLFTNTNASTIGYYNVKLTVRSPGGCLDSYTSMITVYPAIDAAFTASTNVICSGNSITFTSLPGASRYDWEYGDGVNIRATNSTSHLYTNFTAAPVILQVKLTTTSFYGCTDDTTINITVMPIPLPQFTAIPVTQVFNAAGNPVTFTNTTNDGTWSWLWKFGDGVTSTTQNPTHTYTDIGDFEVWLVVNNANCSDSIKHTVSVLPKAPVAEFDSIPSGCEPLNISIDNTSLNTEIPGTTYRWDFGDGSISTAKNPTYTYFDPGIYRVELTVTGPGGTSTKSQVVNSYPSPKAYFEVSPVVVFVNDEKVRMFNLSQGADSYLWEFGDGDTSKVKEPFHKYMEEGVYDITLWAYSNNGCSDKFILSPGVTVEPAGEVRFSTVFTPNLDGPIDRTDLPTGGIEIDQFFFPPIREKVIDYKLQIFNRLGVLIFESRNINIPWNGYYKGKLCAQGVYVWYVEGKYANGQPFKKVGDVTLLH